MSSISLSELLKRKQALRNEGFLLPSIPHNNNNNNNNDKSVAVVTRQGDNPSKQDSELVKSTTPKKSATQINKFNVKTIAELIAERKAQKQIESSQVEETLSKTQLKKYLTVEGFPLNDEQNLAVQYALDKKDFCLIGGAGTGKTTTISAIANELVKADNIPMMPKDCNSARLANKRSYALVAFTNRAVKRLRQCLPKQMHDNTFTIHKLLEYTKVKVNTIDEKGFPLTKYQFKPMMNAKHQDKNVSMIFIEEASMVSVDLHQLLAEAFPNATLIYLGDLNQIPPVYGNSILGYKLTHLPIVELQRVYRQGVGSPIIDLAYLVKQGRVLSEEEVQKICDIESPAGKVSFSNITKKIEGDSLLPIVARNICRRILSNEIDIDNCQILMPFNKAFGSVEMNKHIAQALGEQRGAEVNEIHAGFSMQYFAVGDKVIHNKHEYYISEIKKNGFYLGRKAASLRTSTKLNRWGFSTEVCQETLDKLADFSLEEELNKASAADDDQSKRAASHKITLTPCFIDECEDVELTSSGDIAGLEFAYAITIHKSQGSEWKRVLLVFHHSNATMLSRELLYTAITRASEHLEIIAELPTFCKAPKSKRVKGDNLQEKVDYFVSQIHREEARGIDPINNVRTIALEDEDYELLDNEDY